MREPIDKLYLLILQSFRNEMGLIDDRTWIENLDTLYKAERDRTDSREKTELRVSTAGYNNDSISKSVPDENFWKEREFLYTEPENPTAFPINIICQGENDGDLMFTFYDANATKKVYDFLNTLLKKTLYADDVPVERVNDDRMGIYKLHMEEGDRRLIVGLKNAVYVVYFVRRFVRFSKFGNYFVMEGE